MKSEFDLIEQLLGAAGLPARGLSGELPVGFIGPGDDCAAINLSQLAHSQLTGARGWLAISTDSYVAGRHFSSAYSTPEDIGWKCLAGSLSDLAAAGATPTAAVVGLLVGGQASAAELGAVYTGLYECAAAYGAHILGGDTSAAAELALNITVLGFCERAPLQRLGAAVGDDLWVTGSIGCAGAGLSLLQRGVSLEDSEAENLRRHRRPLPRIECGCELLRRGIASAAIDVSDGLLQDAAHIAARSGVRLRIDEGALPLAQCGGKPVSLVEAITAGEDYELLFTADRQLRSEIEQLAAELAPDYYGLPLSLSRIGEVVEKGEPEAAGILPDVGGIELRLAGGERVGAAEFLQRFGKKTAGYDHFSRK